MIVGIGIDAVDIERIKHMFADHGERMSARLFTPEELMYIRTKSFPAQHMAVRLAAKEAAYKALTGNDLARAISWRDIEVFTRADGAPELRLHGRAAARFAEVGGTSVHVSLTHSAVTAVAVVIVER
ncbi:MAG TPA: holo-ACP synthase [Gemmatimonadaceae bacterium]|nr:holo-ACP synthase [Gemmatimonadaceae bacterium]